MSKAASSTTNDADGWGNATAPQADIGGIRRLEVQTLADRAYDMLDKAILTGELEPGLQLGEAELAQRIGISRGPLREAINRLEGRRLVQRIPHVGVRVVSLSDWDVSEIFAVREVLEGLACRLSTQQMSDEEINSLEGCLDFRHVSAEPEPGSALYGRPEQWDFHYRVAKGSRNQQLVQYLCGDMYSLLRLYRARTGTKPMRAHAGDEHREILAAMQARDGERAEKLMREHIARARTSLQLDEDVTRAT